jgi:hypothetical protein
MPPDATRVGSDRQALALQLGGFELDVEGLASHDTDDTWDATWLAATATCDAPGAAVSARQVVLTSWSVRRFCEGLVELARSHEGCALLAAEQPELSVCARASPERGHVSMRVDITPVRGRQGHWFVYDIDETRLPGAIEQCRAILAAFPTREVPAAPDNRPPDNRP